MAEEIKENEQTTETEKVNTETDSPAETPEGEAKEGDIQESEATKDAGNAEEEAEEKPKKLDKFEKRIKRATARNASLLNQLAEKDAREAVLLNEIANLKQGKTENTNEQPVDQNRIRQEAYNQAQFDIICNNIADKGSKEFPDFIEANAELTRMGITFVRKGNQLVATPLLQMITDLDAPTKVLHYLGTNPDEAEDIAELSPVKQAAALAKLETKLLAEPVKKISKAPPPVKPVDSKSGSNTSAYGSKYYKGMPPAEFAVWDDNQSKKNKANH